MCLDLLAESRFLLLLLEFDQQLAAHTRAGGCHCGAPLHVANYGRKPRGTRCEPPEGFSLRLSFCCGRDGCRQRSTPPSVRFLGPKVYVAAAVVIGAILRHGPTPLRLEALGEALGVHSATVARWRAWWLERFAQSPFWRSLHSRFAPDLDLGRLPGVLLEAFSGTPAERLLALLRLLAPITTRPGLAVHAP